MNDFAILSSLSCIGRNRSWSDYWGHWRSWVALLFVSVRRIYQMEKPQNTSQNQIEIYHDRSAHRARREELSKDHFLVDLHVHSTLSDGIHSLQALVQRAESLGIYFCLTDHNKVPKEDLNLYERVIPWIEVGCREWIDVLVYFFDWQEARSFYEREIRPFSTHCYRTGVSIRTLLQTISSYHAVVNIAHINNKKRAFMPQWNAGTITLSPEEQSRIACMEIFNANSDFTHMPEKEAFLSHFSVHRTIWSDAHSLYSLGNAVMYSRAKTKQDFLLDLVQGNCSWIGIKSTLFQRIFPLWKSAYYRLIPFTP